MKRNVHMVNIVSVDNIFRQLVIIWSLSHLFPDGGSTKIICEKASKFRAGHFIQIKHNRLLLWLYDITITSLSRY